MAHIDLTRVGFAALVVAMVVGLACSTSRGSCDTVVEYRLGQAVADSGTNGFGANVSGHPLDDCDVKFVSGTAVAEYVLHPWAGDAAPFNVGPALQHLPDSQVCKTFTDLDACAWVALAGPPPAYCRRSEDCVDMGFDEAMRRFLGSSTYEVRLTCGKDLLLQTSGLDSNRQVCLL